MHGRQDYLKASRILSEHEKKSSLKLRGLVCVQTQKRAGAKIFLPLIAPSLAYGGSSSSSN
jgi:hypothetical protein